MKIYPKALMCMAALAMLSGCKMDEEKTTWDEYAEWREVNENWLAEQAARKNPDGTPYFTRIVPEWNKNAYVLMHRFNDPKTTEGNLRPLYNSTVDIKYYGQLYNDEPFDSSYTSITPADSVRRMKLSGTVKGFAIAMEKMHVGDTVEVVIPYAWGYGSSSMGIIKPYSALRFGIKLVDVAGEYIRP